MSELKVFYDHHGFKCNVVNRFFNEGYWFVNYNIYVKSKGYFTMKVEYERIIFDGFKNGYYFKSKYLYNKKYKR